MTYPKSVVSAFISLPLTASLLLSGSVIFIFSSLSAFAVEAPLLVEVTYLKRAEEKRIPLSLLDLPIEDNGTPGARLGLRDNQTTGRFLGQEHTLEEVVVGEDESIVTVYKELLASGRRLFLADLGATDLLTIADIDPHALLFNIRAQDDRLRDGDCRANILHVPPSRGMLTDALAQYLNWKRWNRIVLVTGRYDTDKAYAEAFRRSARRFGLKIVDEKDWTAAPGARRTDSGHHSLQQEVPVFTQFKDHDVVVVADEEDEFGEYLSYRSTRPRPVAGTHGLLSTAWHRTQEQWGATQIQRRFEKLAGRWMTDRDYAAWASMRALGEATTNTRSNKVADIRAFLLSDKLKLAGFKGVPLSFRRWNGQLRQPILLVAPRVLISVSPQQGFLHEFSTLDTMGLDVSETSCTQFNPE